MILDLNRHKDVDVLCFMFVGKLFNRSLKLSKTLINSSFRINVRSLLILVLTLYQSTTTQLYKSFSYLICFLKRIETSFFGGMFDEMSQILKTAYEALSLLKNSWFRFKIENLNWHFAMASVLHNYLCIMPLSV